MKTSIKISVLLAGLTALSVKSHAQSAATSAGSGNGIIYSVGVDGGFSTGNFKDTHKWSVGGSVQADIPVADHFFVTVNAGYSNFFGRDNIYGTTFSATDIHLLPTKAGLKYFPVNWFYVQADAGAAFVLNKSDVGYDKTAAFIYSPQVGVQLPIGGKSLVDVGAFYEASTKFASGIDNSKVNFFGLRVAYAFSLK